MFAPQARLLAVSYKMRSSLTTSSKIDFHAEPQCPSLVHRVRDSESGAVLCALVRLCYPVQDPLVTSHLGWAGDVLRRALCRYPMAHAENAARSLWLKFAWAPPLRRYSAEVKSVVYQMSEIMLQGCDDSTTEVVRRRAGGVRNDVLDTYKYSDRSYVFTSLQILTPMLLTIII